MLKDRFDGAVVVEARDLERADAPLARRREPRERVRVIAAFDNDGVSESVLEHVFEAVDLEVIFSLLAKLDVQPNWCCAGAQRIDASE